MPVTTYTDVPAHRIHKGRVCATKAYRTIMARIGRAIKADAEVIYSARAAGSATEEGDIVDWISVTIGDPPCA